MSKPIAPYSGVLTLLGLFLAIPSTLLRGFVLTQLWTWFAVPLSLPALGIAQALGLSMVAHFVTFQHVPNDEDYSLIKAVVRSTSMSLICWGVAAIYVRFI